MINKNIFIYCCWPCEKCSLFIAQWESCLYKLSSFQMIEEFLFFTLWKTLGVLNSWQLLGPNISWLWRVLMTIKFRSSIHYHWSAALPFISSDCHHSLTSPPPPPPTCHRHRHRHARYTWFCSWLFFQLFHDHLILWLRWLILKINLT